MKDENPELCVQEGLGLYERIHERTTQQHLPLGDVLAQAEFPFDEVENNPMPELTSKLQALNEEKLTHLDPESENFDPTTWG